MAELVSQGLLAVIIAGLSRISLMVLFKGDFSYLLTANTLS